MLMAAILLPVVFDDAAGGPADASWDAAPLVTVTTLLVVLRGPPA